MTVPPNLVHDLPPFDEVRNLRVVVETPQGASVKLKYDDKLGCFSLTRILPLGIAYPYDFGFVPQTLAQDGDPIDVMILMDVATYPGVVVPSRLLGALQIEERGMRGRPNHRLVAVPAKAARKDDIKDYEGLGERMLRELERFFVMATAFTAKDPQIRGWVGPELALDMVNKAIQRYKDRQGGRRGDGRDSGRGPRDRDGGREIQPAEPEARPEAKAEAKAEVKAEAKPETKAEAKIEAPLEPKADSKFEAEQDKQPG